MTDPPGVPSALGIESVDYLQEGGNVTVRVSGRWRRRRPDWHGPALLMIESEGMRHRFPAMPDPPSLSGTLPGTWRMSFSVAAELAPQLGGDAWLQLGSMAVPLPLLAEAELRAAAEEAKAYRVARAQSPETLAARELRSAEVAAQSARQRAARAEADVAELLARVDELERALDRALEEPERLDALLSEANRRRRAAEQRAHAETALRIEAEERLATGRRTLERAQARAAALSRRVEELERERLCLERAADEAEHGAAGARAGRAQAEHRLRELERRSGDRPRARERAATLQREIALAHWSRTVLPRGDRPAARPPTSSVVAVPSLVAELEMLALRRRVGAPRMATLEQVLGDERRRWAAAVRGIEEVRQELDELRRAYAEPAPSPPPSGPDEPPEVVQAEELAEALARLRESAPAPPRAAPPTPAPPPLVAGHTLKPWLAPIFRHLAKADAAAAGRLVLALLPAQRAVSPMPVAYDLVLGERSCVRVTVGNGPPDIEYAHERRPDDEVQFRVDGDLARLAQLLASGRLRRRLGRDVARIHGERSAATALRALVDSPLSLRRLHALGVRVDAGIALALGTGMLRPEWTTGERFTIAHHPVGAPEPGFHLRISDGAPLVVFDRPPAEEAGTTIVCPGEALLPALAGARGGNVFVRGDHRPAELISEWLERAQCV